MNSMQHVLLLLATIAGSAPPPRGRPARTDCANMPPAQLDDALLMGHLRSALGAHGYRQCVADVRRQLRRLPAADRPACSAALLRHRMPCTRSRRTGAESQCVDAKRKCECVHLMRRAGGKCLPAFAQQCRSTCNVCGTLLNVTGPVADTWDPPWNVWKVPPPGTRLQLCGDHMHAFKEHLCWFVGMRSEHFDCTGVCTGDRPGTAGWELPTECDCLTCGLQCYVNVCCRQHGLIDDNGQLTATTQRIVTGAAQSTTLPALIV